MATYRGLQSFSKISSRPQSFWRPSGRFFSKEARPIAPIPEALNRWPSTQVSKLANGLTVATEEGNGEVATIGLYVDVGSYYENKANNGSAHFIGRLSLKGTNKRTQSQIESQVYNLGSQISHSSSRQQTSHQASVLKNDVEQTVELLSDILANPALKEEAIEKEKESVLADIHSVSQDHPQVVLDHLHSIAFQGYPLGMSHFGGEDNVKAFNRSDLLKFHADHFTAGRVVLVGTGGVKHTELLKYANQFLGGLKASESGQAPHVRFTGSQLVIPDDHLHSIHSAFGIYAPGWNHPAYFTFRVLQSLLGSWSKTSSFTDLKTHLAETVAHEKFAESFSTFYYPYHNHGLFGVQTVSGSGELVDLPNAIFEEMVRMSQSVSQHEIDQAVKRLLTSFYGYLNSSSVVNSTIGRQILTTGKRTSPQEVFQTYQSIDVGKVKAVADEFIFDVDPVVVAMGAHVIEGIPDYNQIRNATYWRTL